MKLIDNNKLLGKYLSHAIMEESIKPSLDKMRIKFDNFVSESDIHGGKEKKEKDLAKKYYDLHTRQ